MHTSKTRLHSAFLFTTILISILVTRCSDNASLSGHWGSVIFYNGNIITVDPSLPRAGSVVVKDDRIVFVGKSEDALSYKKPDTQMIDLRGKTMVPGFNDNHTHMVMAGSFFSENVLRDKSCSEIAEIVRDEAARKKPGELIKGNSWDYTTCPDPDKSMLDKVAPDNPVFLTQYSGHAAWVNSYKLRELKIDRSTPDPKGGQIVRDKSGEPTGILRDTATGTSEYGDFARQILSPKRHRELMDKALGILRESGITSVQDNTWEPFSQRLLVRYLKDGRLTCRFTCWSSGDTILKMLMTFDGDYDPIWVRRGPVKYFSDGAFATRTGWLSEPYSDEPGNYGAPRYTPGELEKIILSAARDRVQISFHAIGDMAAHEVLNAVEKAQHMYPWTKELRFRMEHVQILMPGDVERMKRLGVLACVQPFALVTPAKDVKMLGMERARRAYPYRSLFKAGVPVSFGSDNPAEIDYHPLLCIYYAVTRKSRNGKEGPINADERFTPEEALYCYTMGSAYAEFMEKEKGSIAPGKLADFTLLSEDLTSIAPEKIKDIDVLMTVVGGTVVYKK